jgi:hypothetical protein
MPYILAYYNHNFYFFYRKSNNLPLKMFFNHHLKGYVFQKHISIYISSIFTLKIHNYVSCRLKPEPGNLKNVKITEVHFILIISAYTYSHYIYFNSHKKKITPTTTFFSGGLTRTRHLLLIMSYSILHYPQRSLFLLSACLFSMYICIYRCNSYKQNVVSRPLLKPYDI